MKKLQAKRCDNKIDQILQIGPEKNNLPNYIGSTRCIKRDKTQTDRQMSPIKKNINTDNK